MAHAFAKFSRGPEAFVNILTALQVPWPHLMAWLTIAVELIGGLSLFLGHGSGLPQSPSQASC